MVHLDDDGDAVELLERLNVMATKHNEDTARRDDERTERLIQEQAKRDEDHARRDDERTERLIQVLAGSGSGDNNRSSGSSVSGLATSIQLQQELAAVQQMLEKGDISSTDARDLKNSARARAGPPLPLDVVEYPLNREGCTLGYKREGAR